LVADSASNFAGSAYFPTFEALTERVEQALFKFTNAAEEILALCSLPTELAQAA